MKTAAQYRQYAQECMDSARAANSDSVRMQFLEIAKMWLAAAVHVDLRSNGKTTWPKTEAAPLEPSDMT